MNAARYVEPADRNEAERMIVAMGDWVFKLAPWHCFSTLTFRWESSVDSTVRAYEKFMRKRLPGVSHFFAVENNPSRDGSHVHALWTNPEVLRSQAWQEWFTQYGRARIEPIGLRHRSKDDGRAGEILVPMTDDPRQAELNVADYCAKYVCKNGAWWNVFLKGGHHPNAHVGGNLLLVS